MKLRLPLLAALALSPLCVTGIAAADAGPRAYVLAPSGKQRPASSSALSLRLPGAAKALPPRLKGVISQAQAPARLLSAPAVVLNTGGRLILVPARQKAGRTAQALAIPLGGGKAERINVTRKMAGVLKNQLAQGNWAGAAATLGHAFDASATAGGRTSAPVAAAAGTAPNSLLKKTIRDDEFKVDRGIYHYIGALGLDFSARLIKLKGHWIDAGAGEARAPMQFLFEEKFNEVVDSGRQFEGVEDPVYRRVHDRWKANDLKKSAALGDAEAKSLLARLLKETKEEAAWGDERAKRYLADLLSDRKLSQEEEAALDYFHEREHASIAPFHDKPTVTAVSLVAAAPDLPRQSGGKFRFLRGRYFLDIPKKELMGRAGQAELITDVFGVFAYDPHPDLVLKRYLGTLRPDGAIFILLGGVRAPARLSQHLVKKNDGTMVSLVDWVKSIQGIEVTHYTNKLFGLPAVETLRITLSGESRASVPKLKLAQVIDKKGSKKLKPLVRLFEEE